jgi:hypothetical protein
MLKKTARAALGVGMLLATGSAFAQTLEIGMEASPADL